MTKFSLMVLLFASAVAATAEQPLLSAGTHSEQNEQSTPMFKKQLSSIESMKGTFRQVLTDPEGEQLQQSEGTFAFKRPGYFLWESEEPFPQTVVGTPEKIWVYDPDLEQVTVKPKGAHDDNNPANLLSGDLSAIQSSFDIDHQQQDGQTKFELTPVSGDDMYRVVVFLFEGDRLVELSFRDKLDQVTRITFDQVQTNIPIADKVFQFTPPEGTDIIVDE